MDIQTPQSPTLPTLPQLKEILNDKNLLDFNRGVLDFIRGLSSFVNQDINSLIGLVDLNIANVTANLANLSNAAEKLANKAVANGYASLDANGVVPSNQLPNIEGFAIGGIYINVTGTNPGTELGYGTWVAFGAGRMLVGYDANQTEFDTVEEIGGNKTHTLTIDEMPSHNHKVYWGPATSGAGSMGLGNITSPAPDTSDTGGGNAHNNLPPYIVVYFWKRTA